MILELLDRAFPSVEPDCTFPHSCWVAGIKAAGKRATDRLKPISEAIAEVERVGQLEVLIHLLQQRHPLDRAHDVQFDREVLDILNEACALSWCVQTVGATNFVPGQGKPDLRAGNVWLEAKNIHSSEDNREAIAQSLADGEPISGSVGDIHPTLLKKFQDGVTDAVKKFGRVNADIRIVLFNIVGLDLGVFPRREYILGELCRWAREAEQVHRVRIVLTEAYRWHRPFYSGREIAMSPDNLSGTLVAEMPD